MRVRPFIWMSSLLLTMAHDARADHGNVTCSETRNGPGFRAPTIVETGEGLVVFATSSDFTSWLGSVDAGDVSGKIEPRTELLVPDAIAGGAGRVLLVQSTGDAARAQIVDPAGDAGASAEIAYLDDPDAGALGNVDVAFDGRDFLVLFETQGFNTNVSTLWITRLGPDGTVRGTKVVATQPARDEMLVQPRLAIDVAGGITYVAWSAYAELRVQRLDENDVPLDAAPLELGPGWLAGLVAREDGALVLGSLDAYTLHRLDGAGTIVRSWTRAVDWASDGRPVATPLGEGILHRVDDEVFVDVLPATEAAPVVRVRVGEGYFPDAVEVGGLLAVASVRERSLGASRYESVIELYTLDAAGTAFGPTPVATLGGQYVESCNTYGCTAAPGRAARGAGVWLSLGALVSIAWGSRRKREPPHPR